MRGAQQSGHAGPLTASCLPRATGERYRREMLAHGGGREPMLLVQGKPDGGWGLSKGSVGHTFEYQQGEFAFGRLQ